MTKLSPPAIVWFRDDLRLADNPALAAAVETGAPLVCLYIYDPANPSLRPLGGASRWWLHHSLERLGQALARLGGRLDIRSGPSRAVLEETIAASGATSVFWNRRYGKGEIALDSAIKAALTSRGIQVASSNSHLLVEPWEIKTKTGGEFKVFSPFWRAALAWRGWSRPHSPPRRIASANILPSAVPLASLGLLPHKPDWSAGLRQEWTPGEAGAQARLTTFLDQGAANYGIDRNRPDLPKTSNLSPHLRFGEISPRQVVAVIQDGSAAGRIRTADAEKFLSEIGWREFAYHLLYHHPELATRNFAGRFDAFPWGKPDQAHLVAWQRGQTGYPIVDAGMRQLWQTGTMHNRVRMITASFLTKHLMIDWRVGESWFWDTLCDADPANNPASWQWVAGSGADAAPYFRIFNPVLQGERFDPEGSYVRRYVPELAEMPDAYIHHPWEAPTEMLKRAGIALGRDYPKPIVDHGWARERALSAFGSLSAQSAA